MRTPTPTHHTNNRRSDGRRATTEEGQWFVLRLHAARQGSFVMVPLSAVHSMPATSTTSGHHQPADIIACPAFDPRNPETSCPLGAQCHFVHVDTTVMKVHPMHVNYAWRSLEDVTYERFEPGHRLEVAPPNMDVTADVMDSGLALKTKALKSTRHVLSHCAHYYFNRTCKLGSECRFVHAVFIDPTAKDHQRAPAPVQLGRSAPPTAMQDPASVPSPQIPHEMTVIATEGSNERSTSSPDGIPATKAVSQASSFLPHASHGSGDSPAHPRQHRPYDAQPIPNAAVSPATMASTSTTSCSSAATSPGAQRARGRDMRGRRL